MVPDGTAEGRLASTANGPTLTIPRRGRSPPRGAAFASTLTVMNWRAATALTAALCLVATAAVSAEPRGDAATLAPGPSPPGLAAPVPLAIVRGFDPPATDWGAGHRGVDLASGAGTHVLSPGDGVVTFAGRVAGRGIVVVRHATGLRSTLEPVTSSVATGDAVREGQSVGVLEQTGSHCAPQGCLHWGVRRGDKYIDPLDVLRGQGPIRLLPLIQTPRS